MADLATWEPQGICEASGFKYPLSQLVRQWDGAMVHRSFVDRRNPQDFVRGVPDNQTIPNARPEAPDTFFASNIMTENGIPTMTEDGEPILTEGGALPVTPDDL